MGSLAETYVKRVRRKPVLPRRVDQMSKEVLQATLVKKRECNKRAQIIVERLLEETVPQDWFLGSVGLLCHGQLQYISESHFQDVVEERAIAKLCGYPLCQGQLPPAPSQQFRISTRLNKVYDITDRKNFCSNRCYAAVKFLKQQLLTSPLWLRDKEEAPVFTLLPTADRSDGVGDELDFSIEKVVAENNESSHDGTAVKCQGTLASEQEDLAGVTEHTQDSENVPGAKLAAREATCSELRSLAQDSSTKDNASGVSSERNICSEINPVANAAQNTGRNCSDKCKIEMVTRVTNVSGVSSVIVETGISLEPESGGYKEEKSGSVSSVCKVDSENISTKSTDNLDNVNSKNTRSACDSSITSMLEERLEVADKQVEAHNKGSRGKKSRSKKGGEESGLRGLVLYVEKCVKEWFTADTLKLLLGEESLDCLCDTGIPLVDHHAQAALRRRIVLDRLNRVVPDLMVALGVVSCDVSGDMRELVTTFSLGAHNITFHVPEWNLLGLILINIVSLKNERLQQQLRSKKVKNAQSLILLSFQQDSGYLDRLMCWLVDIDNKSTDSVIYSC